MQEIREQIPKVIHYCWFGRGEKPDIIKKCMKSWKEKCPDYEIIEWNEDNFDVNYNQYTKDAYSAKKYAFVSDVARLWIIYNYGGTYLDTDVELKVSLDELCNNTTWLASDTAIHINTGLGFGSVKGNDIIKKILDDYENRPYDTTSCVILNTRIVKKYIPEIKSFGKTQIAGGITFIGAEDYGKYARHIYTSTYFDEKQRKKKNKLNNRPKWYRKFKWKVFCKMQHPKLLHYAETHNNFISKFYMFFVFDAWYGGFGRWFQLIGSRFKKKKKPDNT